MLHCAFDLAGQRYAELGIAGGKVSIADQWVDKPNGILILALSKAGGAGMETVLGMGLL